MAGDKRLYDVIFAEGGGGPSEEIAAIASVFLNRASRYGLEKALKGSSAYTTKSPQYKLASSGKMSNYERAIYERNKEIVDSLLANPERIGPYTYMENVRAFGNPPWIDKMASYKDIGRQRFYISKEDVGG